MNRSLDLPETQDRLLAAAMDVFSEVGYRQATLREICRRAGANVAAVNYHFRDKEQLYYAVLERALASCGEGLDEVVPPAGASPEEKLGHVIRVFMQNMLGVGRPLQLLRLVAHEMVEPTPALEVVVAKAVLPLNHIARAIVAELLGPAATPELVRECTSSVLAQCVEYDHSKAFLQRVDNVDVHDPATIERLAEHVFQFSLGGIRAMASENPKSETRNPKQAQSTKRP